MRKKDKKVLFIYSDSQYSNVALHWLANVYDKEVVVLKINLGEKEDKTQEKRELLALGAARVLQVDARNEFVEGYITKAIKANGIYEEKYPLTAALARPLIAKEAVKAALNNSIFTIAHGNSGNDRLRLDSYISSLTDRIKVIPILSKWDINDENLDSYVNTNKIKIGSNYKMFSISENLWGRSIEKGELEDISREPTNHLPVYVKDARDTPDKPTYVTLGFKSGIPISLNSKSMPLLNIIIKLNKIASINGVGSTDTIEDGIVGLKTHAIYEWPAAFCIIEAHKELERLASTIHQNKLKPIIDNEWSYAVYAGLWYDPLLTSLNSFIDANNKNVTGKIRLKLHKGKLTVVGRESKHALYSKDVAIYRLGYNTADYTSMLEGFINIYSLHMRFANKNNKKR